MVFLVAVPLCLGIAMASGAPLFAGIIAGIVGGIVVMLISGSQLGVSGPAAGLAVIVLKVIQGLGSFEVFLSAVVLAGVIQVALGLLKAGSISYYFPASVIKGMLSGIGVIIILKQVPHAFGYDSSFEGSVHYIEPDGDTTAEETSFLNKGNILQTLRKLPDNVDMEINYSRSAYIDPDVRELIEDFKETARSKRINLKIKQVEDTEKIKAEKVLL